MIVKILEKNKSDYTDDDVDHMQRVVSYVHRHQAQKPSGDVEDSRSACGSSPPQPVSAKAANSANTISALRDRPPIAGLSSSRAYEPARPSSS